MLGDREFKSLLEGKSLKRKKLMKENIDGGVVFANIEGSHDGNVLAIYFKNEPNELEVKQAATNLRGKLSLSYSPVDDGQLAWELVQTPVSEMAGLYRAVVFDIG